jgi:hypothetical protein
MDRVSMFEVERKIGYWQRALSKIERSMMKMQSERVDMKHKLIHLHHLQNQQELYGEEIESS